MTKLSKGFAGAFGKSFDEPKRKRAEPKHQVKAADRCPHDLTVYRPSREPCPYCAVRPEVGCRHVQRWSE